MNYLKKHIVSAFVLLFFQVSFAQSLPTGNDSIKSEKDQISNGYKLVWQDNFDGKTLDVKNNWKIDVDGNGGGNKELQYYRKQNIIIGKEPVSGESCLIITAKKENYLSKEFTSGRLSTKDKVSFKYGKIEARIKFPTIGNGIWPAFWMLGKGFPEINWPKCGEIDILEIGNAKGIKKGVQDKYYSGACHWGESWNNGQYPHIGKASISSYSLVGDFHLFTLIWDEKELKMYLDLDKYPNNLPYYTLPIAGEDKPENAAHYYNKDFFIIFNLAVGGNFTGILNPQDITALTNGEAKMYVDYVRVYQKGIKNEQYTFNSGEKTK
jgi:beta-glucanase (GH16 family)